MTTWEPQKQPTNLQPKAAEPTSEETFQTPWEGGGAQRQRPQASTGGHTRKAEKESEKGPWSFPKRARRSRLEGLT